MQLVMLGALLFLCSLNGQAQIYKWIDQNGNTQYSSQPPAAAFAKSEKKLNIKVKSTSKGEQSPNSTQNLVDERAEFDKRQQKKQEDEKKNQAEAEEMNKKCLHAQGRLKTYRDTARLTVPDGKGGIQYVDDALREKTITEINKEIATFCR